MAKDKYEGFEQNKRNKEIYSAKKETLDPRNNEDFVFTHEENKITWTNEVHIVNAEANNFDSTLNQDEKGVEFEDNDKYNKNTNSTENDAASTTASTSSSSSAASTATSAGSTAGGVVHTVAVATTTAIIVVVGGGMAINSQSYDKPQFVQIIEPYATKNSISFVVAIANSEEEAYQSSDKDKPESCDIVVELECESLSSFHEERYITNFGLFEYSFDNLRTGTVYTVNVAQRTFLDLNREYLIEPLLISTIPNIPTTMETNGQTTIFHANSEFYYDGTCTVTYDDDSTREISSSQITVDSSQVMMNKQGKYPVTLLYTEGDVTISTSYTAEVIAGDITISAEQEPTGGINYYSEIEMFIDNPTSKYIQFYMCLYRSYVDYDAESESVPEDDFICNITLNRQDPFSKQQVWFDVEDSDLSGTKYLVLWGTREEEGEIQEGMSEPPIEYYDDVLVTERIDLSQLDIDILPVPQSLALTGQTTSFHANDTFTFDGSGVVSYDDGTTQTFAAAELYVDSSNVDMSTQGIYDVTVSVHTNGMDVSETYQVEVIGGEITISGESDPFGNITYYSEIEMYLDSDVLEAYNSFNMLIVGEQLNYNASYEDEREYCIDEIELNSDNPFEYQEINFQLSEWEDATFFTLWATSDEVNYDLLICQLINLPSIDISPKNETAFYVQRYVDESDPPTMEYYGILHYGGYYDEDELDTFILRIYDVDNGNQYMGYIDSGIELDATIDLTSKLTSYSNFNDNGTYMFNITCQNHNPDYVAQESEGNGSGGYTVSDGAPYNVIDQVVDFSTISETSVKTKPTITGASLYWFYTPNNPSVYKPYINIDKRDPGNHYEPTGLVLVDKEDNDNGYTYALTQSTFSPYYYQIVAGHDIFDPNGVDYLDKFTGDVGIELYVNSTYESDEPQNILIDDLNITTERSEWQSNVEHYPSYTSLQFFGDETNIETTETMIDLIGFGEEIMDDEEYKVVITNINDSSDSYEIVLDSDTGLSRYVSYYDLPVRSGHYSVATYVSDGGVDRLVFLEEDVDFSTLPYSV